MESSKRYTDRELLQSCLRAMEVSQRHGEVTDWRHMIEALRTHLAHETKSNPFEETAILANPDTMHIDIRFQNRKDYEAALVFLDMGSPQEETKERPQSVNEPCEHGVIRAHANCIDCHDEGLRRAFTETAKP